MQGGQDKSLWHRDTEIFVVSVLILYLELLLIRWIGTEIRVFAYLGNLILVVCFFGVGLGCYLSSLPLNLTRLGLNLAVLTFLIANPLHVERLQLSRITDWLAGFEDSPLWDMFHATKIGVTGALAIVGALLYLIVFTFVPLGQILGKSVGEHPRTIRAYSVNIAGSLTGIWLLNVCSWLSTPPVVWFVILSGLIILVAALGLGRLAPIALLAAVALFFVWRGSPNQGRTIWSPYQKLQVTPFLTGPATNQTLVGYDIVANGIAFQSIVNLSDDFIDAHPGLLAKEEARYSHYNMPFAFHPGIQRVLIVGAGAGNNAAAALRHGAQTVDCVEIDPLIYALGKELHPEHPYESPRVRMIVDDARAFLKRARGPYDLIWFGLLDAHPASSYDNRRLDHYVYTIECFQDAQRLLAADGLLVMNFAARRPWISDRLQGMLRQVFGQPPLTYHAGYGLTDYGVRGELTLVTSQKPVVIENLPEPWLREYVTEHRLQLPGITRPTTDDWPYLYLEHARIPKLHLVTSLTLLATVTLAGRRVLGRQTGVDWHFFALGAAFLLLEVQTVSRATLLFGMTWVVNAIVISAVLIMILLANLVAWRWQRFPQWLTMVGLATTVAVLAVIPLGWFNTLAGLNKLLVASAFLTAPVFFAGLIFIRSFAVCADKANALGSNLIGALVGGLLESLSFVTGIRSLVLLVGAFYIAALLLRPRAAT